MTINSKLNKLIVSSKELYHRLVLIVGEKNACSRIIHETAESYGKQPININLDLSEKLLQLNHKKRQLKLQNLMWNLVKDEKEIVFLTDTEILFDSSLQQDPLKILQEVSRNIRVVAYWGGEVNNAKLVYAIPNHSEYREYSSNDVVFINTEGKTSFELDC
ncbi:BREX-3 system P-loop-containing protein BrxF [uncultured Psychrobacter sp.]|uniref:BREX-3 system P-loop-containing protein BrxF n=1 Tax=uncultured Psychrobacter sp. TaxID=259303 RepID=UPI00345A902F